MIITKQLPECKDFSLVVLGANTNSPEDDLFVIFDESPEMIEPSSEVASPCSLEVPAMIFSSLDVLGMAGWLVSFSNINSDEVLCKIFCSPKVSDWSLDLPEMNEWSLEVSGMNGWSLELPGIKDRSLWVSEMNDWLLEFSGMYELSLEVPGINDLSLEVPVINGWSLELPGINGWSLELPGINDRSL